jgi:hypothetical protein
MFGEFARHKLLSPEQVAEILGKNPDTLRRWRKRGIGPRYFVLDGHTVRYSVKDLEEYLSQHAPATPGHAAAVKIEFERAGHV